MKFTKAIIGAVLIAVFAGAPAYSAYHHQGESDAKNFTDTYPEKTGTKLDHCNLCHSGGEYINSKDKLFTLGSCQWCHRVTEYGTDYGASNANLLQTINAYGKAYQDNGRDVDAIKAIENLDSDGDGHTNIAEINANRSPGDKSDDPTMIEAPSLVLSLADLTAMQQHTQFMLMNTSRSGDFYAEYTGVPVQEILKSVDIRPEATGITVFAPDGWSQYHPLRIQDDPELYHIFGTYPAASYNYDIQADENETPDKGWCDYTAPSCSGRAHGDPINVENGLRAILALKRESADITAGVLNDENKLDGEGPFRVIVPQKSPNPPDQSSSADAKDVIWPYKHEWDHNAGACSRSATIIRVEPLPEGTSDINVYEAGWNYIDDKKIIIYGAINSDVDDDGIVDSKDDDTKVLITPDKTNIIRISAKNRAFKSAVILKEDDTSLNNTGKPSKRIVPYGVFKFKIIGLTNGEEVTASSSHPVDLIL